MTSDPPLSQEDIVLLLTIGMTRAEVDQLQAELARRERRARGPRRGERRRQGRQAGDSHHRRLPLRQRLRPASGKTEPQVTVGKRLTENVRASVSARLSSDEDRECASNLERRLNQRLSVQVSYDNINDVSSTVGNVGVDLRWRLEFE